MFPSRLAIAVLAALLLTTTPANAHLTRTEAVNATAHWAQQPGRALGYLTAGAGDRRNWRDDLLAPPLPASAVTPIHTRRRPGGFVSDCRRVSSPRGRVDVAPHRWVRVCQARFEAVVSRDMGQPYGVIDWLRVVTVEVRVRESRVTGGERVRVLRGVGAEDVEPEWPYPDPSGADDCGDREENCPPVGAPPAAPDQEHHG